MELHTKQFANTYEQCYSSPTLGPIKMLTAPLMVIYKKKIYKALLYYSYYSS